MILGPILEETRMNANIKEDFRRKMHDDMNTTGINDNNRPLDSKKETFIAPNDEIQEFYEDLNSQDQILEISPKNRNKVAPVDKESEIPEAKQNEEHQKSGDIQKITVDQPNDTSTPEGDRFSTIPLSRKEAERLGRASISVLLKSPSEPLPFKDVSKGPPAALMPLLLNLAPPESPPRKLSVSKSNDDVTASPHKAIAQATQISQRTASPVVAINPLAAILTTLQTLIYSAPQMDSLLKKLVKSIKRHTRRLAETGGRRKAGIVCPVFQTETNCVLTVEVGVKPEVHPVLTMLIKVMVLPHISTSGVNENVTDLPQRFEGVSSRLTGDEWIELLKGLDLATFANPLLGSNSYEDFETLLEYFLLKALKIQVIGSNLVVSWMKSNPGLLRFKHLPQEEIRVWHLYSYTYRVVVSNPETPTEIKNWFDVVLDHSLFHTIFETDTAPTMVSNNNLVTPEKRLSNVATFPKRISEKNKLEAIIRDVCGELSLRWVEICTTNSVFGDCTRQVIIKLGKDGAVVGAICHMNIKTTKDEGAHEINRLLRHISVNSMAPTFMENKSSLSSGVACNAFEFFKLKPSTDTSKYGSSNISSVYPSSKIVAIKTETIADIFGFDIEAASMLEKHYCNLSLFEMIVCALGENSQEIQAMDPAIQENLMRGSPTVGQMSQPMTNSDSPELPTSNVVGTEQTKSDFLKGGLLVNKASSAMSPIQQQSAASSPFFSGGLEQLISQTSSKLASFSYNPQHHEVLVKRSCFKPGEDHYASLCTFSVLRVRKKILGVKLVIFSPSQLNERGLFLPVDLLQWKSLNEDSSFDGVPGFASSSSSSAESKTHRATMNSPASLILIDSPERLPTTKDVSDFPRTSPNRKNSRTQGPGLIESLGSPMAGSPGRRPKGMSKAAHTDHELLDKIREIKPLKIKSPVLQYVRRLEWSAVVRTFRPRVVQVSEGVFESVFDGAQPDDQSSSSLDSDEDRGQDQPDRLPRQQEASREIDFKSPGFLSIHAMFAESLLPVTEDQEEEYLD